MKNPVLLLSLSILFQSFFSDKTVDYNGVPILKTAGRVAAAFGVIVVIALSEGDLN